MGDRLSLASNAVRRTLSNAGRKLISIKPATPTQARNVAQAEAAAAGGTEAEIKAAGQAAEMLQLMLSLINLVHGLVIILI